MLNIVPMSYNSFDWIVKKLIFFQNKQANLNSGSLKSIICNLKPKLNSVEIDHWHLTPRNNVLTLKKIHLKHKNPF